MRLVTLSGFALLTLSGAAFASSAAIDLNEEVVHLEVTGQPNPKALEFSAGLYHHDDESDSRSDDDAQIYYAGVVTKDRMTNFRDVEFSLGGHLGHLAADAVDGTYIGLNAAARYYLPDAKGVSAGVALQYAPDVLSSDDVEAVYGFNAELAWAVVPTGQIYGGYRHIELEVIDDIEVTFDEGWFAGFRLLF